VLRPSENIVIILVASKHRKEGFEFVDEIIKWFKTKITFWKKENYINGSDWLEKQS
jgi:molybdopterin synthase catalytic subunit